MLIALFVTFMLPVHPMAGGLRLDPYRLLLIVLFIPFVHGLMTRKAGRFTPSDGLMLAFGGWIVITLVYHHGMSKFAFGSILAIELFGGYAAGRLLVRNAEDFRRYIGYVLTALVFLLPFVLFELFTGRMMIAEILGKVLPASEKYPEWRFGLSRVQGVFPQSILYGLFCSFNAANVYYLNKDRFGRVLPRIALVLGMTMASLSSAPTLAIGIQMLMIIWGKITGARWWLLVGLAAAAFIFLEFASNRGPIIILIETVTLDPQTGWWRYYIWQYGSQSVTQYPLFGIGLNDWARPYWMAPASVDNFWLLIAMRHGVPGITLLIAAIVTHVVQVVRAKGLPEERQNIRTGYMIGLVGLCFTLTTVHVWDVLAVYVMFYLGAASFLYTAPPDTDGAAPAPVRGTAMPRNRKPVVYARSFPTPAPAAPAPAAPAPVAPFKDTA